MYLVHTISMLNFLLNKIIVLNLSLFLFNKSLIADKFNLISSYGNDIYVTVN